MRTLTYAAAVAAGLWALGCGGTDPHPLAPAGPLGTASLGGVAAGPLGAQAALGLYDIHLDPQQATATVELVARREAQATDDVYLLSIGNFLRPTSLAVRSIATDGTNLFLNYTFTHPFAAPASLAGPATAGNRADLGISGQVLFLLDVPSPTGNSYFNGSAIAETSLVANADGYSQPAGLLSNTGTSTNTFPFKLLVDEALDPRTGTASGTPISNGGQAVGNYDVAIGGWQQANIGPSHDGWTGYGVLHQGQTASNTLRLNLAALSAGPVTLRTAIIANYNDPRGGANGREKRANRLPKSPADVFAFTYRMPHGATDVEAVEFLGESGGFVTNQVSASTLRFRVRDWDARAVETTEADLALDPIVTNVAPGESGPPALQVSIPDVLGPGAVELFDNATDLKDDDSAFGGDPEQDSGLPGDVLFYERAITKTVTSGQTDGPKTGMVAALDAEFFADTSGWQFPLDETLTPLPAASQPRPETLQAFQVQLGGLSSPPTVNLTVTTPTVVSGGMASVQASGYSDPEGDPIEVRIDWNNDGDFSDAGESGNMLSGSGGAPLTFTSPTPYTWSGSNPDNRSLPAQYTDNLSTPINVPGLGFTVVEAGASYCPVSAPWTNPAPITTGFGSSAIYTPPNRTEVEFDFGHFRVPTFNFPTANSNAGVVTQNIVDSATPSYELIRVSMNGPLVTDGVTFIPLTSAPGTFGSSNATARNLHQIEVDSTNRVVFARMQPGMVYTQLPAPTGATGTYANASTGFTWFTTDGGSTLATDANMTTVPTAAPPVALAIGINDDVYAIDNQHRLRRYIKAANYAEDTGTPFPINLTAPPFNMTLGSHYVHDFDVNLYNGAFFVLAEETGGNELLYRIECNGTLVNPAPGSANPNPAVTQVTTFGTPAGRLLDIVIDQWSPTGAPLGGQSDAQIVLIGFNGINNDEFHFFNSQLARTGGTAGVVAFYRGTINVGTNVMVTRSGTSVLGLRLEGPAPAGWQ